MASLISNTSRSRTSTSETNFGTTVEQSRVHAIGYANDVVNTAEEAIRDMFFRLQKDVASALQNMFPHLAESAGTEDRGMCYLSFTVVVANLRPGVTAPDSSNGGVSAQSL